ncbi:hypothetical protein JG687_00019542 [Phytophthora cactorum]|uniref:Uncharacterized protein n=1 Tax=Phytophthora cactorum TaxID=29920 RepID=A0A8T1TKG2_9STRA|nr:hypothetical protein JG687_00019542 [Phytophthora cactorum]
MTSTSFDEKESRFRLIWLITTNKKILESNSLHKSIVPIVNGEKNTPEVYNNGYVWIDRHQSIGVYGKESNLLHPTATKKVNWSSTLSSFLDLAKEMDLEIDSNEDAELVSKPYELADDGVEARDGIKTGLDEDKDNNISIPDNEANTMIKAYYEKLQEKGVKIAFRLKPIVNFKNGVKEHTLYYFGKPMLNRILNIRNAQHKPVYGDAFAHLMKTRWMDTFESLLNGIEAMYSTIHNIEGAKTDEEIKTENNIYDNLQILRDVISKLDLMPCTAHHMKTKRMGLIS